jgi:hypothetical protein
MAEKSIKAQSIKKVVAEGPEGHVDVTVNFMDDGSIRVSLPDSPWFITSAFMASSGVSQILFIQAAKLKV